MASIASLRWCLIANVIDPRPTKFRIGARVILLRAQAEVGRAHRLRYEARGLSIGGRVITAFVRTEQLARPRVSQARMLPWFGFDTKADAAAVLARVVGGWTAALTPARAAAVANGQYIRASNDCPCPTCGRPYRQHPLLATFDWLNVLCDGTLVKL